MEAALIDACPGLTNLIAGEGSGERGALHASEIVQENEATPAYFEHRAQLISINRSASERSLYEATRYTWKLSQERAEQAEVVLACEKGLIRRVYILDKWLEATSENLPCYLACPGQLVFIGSETPAAVRDRYIGRRVPHEYRLGTANPVYLGMRLNIGPASLVTLHEVGNSSSVRASQEYSRIGRGRTAIGHPQCRLVAMKGITAPARE